MLSVFGTIFLVWFILHWSCVSALAVAEVFGAAVCV